MSVYERRSAAGAGRQRLPRKDSSRFAAISLTVHRLSTGKGTVTVTVRQVGGGMLFDRRLHTAVIDLSPGSLSSSDPLAALQCALDALLNMP